MSLNIIPMCSRQYPARSSKVHSGCFHPGDRPSSRVADLFNSRLGDICFE